MSNGLIPLNYAILQHFEDIDEACASDVIEALKPLYSGYHMFKQESVEEVLMTSVVNGLLDKSRRDLDENGKLRVYYKINDYGRDMVDKYIGQYRNPAKKA